MGIPAKQYVGGRAFQTNLMTTPDTDTANYYSGYNNYYHDSSDANSHLLTTIHPSNAIDTGDANSSPGSGILSEYLETGVTSEFLQKYSRQLTIAASSLSVLILLLIGGCVWCIIGIVKRGLDEKGDPPGEENDSNNSRDARERGDGEEQFASDELDSSYDASEGSDANKKFKTNGAGKKNLPIISKIFSKLNGNSGNIMVAQHRNVITPDHNIPFIVPTISLPAQPPGRKGDIVIAYHDSPLSTSSSQPCTSSQPTGQHQQGLLMAQQFFPQLEHPEVDTCPLIAFSLFYELCSQILNVRLLEGRNFPDSVNHSVAVKIYPGRSAKQSTLEFKAKSPVYNQEFCYHVRKSSLHTKILKLRAVIPGTPKRIIGYVNVALKDLPGFDITSEEDIKEDLRTTHLWRRVELPSDIGDGVKLQVSLKWSPEPSPGLLTLKVIEASGLHENRECDYTSSYVKVTLQEQGRNIKTRKTQLVRWGSVPVFDDVFVLTIPKELLSQISFLLVVIARGRLGSKAVLGKICIGPVPYVLGAVSGGTPGAIRTASSSSSPSAAATTPAFSSSGTEFWEDMCHQPDSEIVRWLHLIP